MKLFAFFAPSRLTLLGAAVAACNGSSGGDWPDRLYLALDGGETAVRLSEEEPEPY